MKVILVILLLAAMGATLFMLIKGIVTFLKTTEADLRNDGAGPSQSSLKQNRAMMGRITFQAIAILLLALIMLAFGGK